MKKSSTDLQRPTFRVESDIIARCVGAEDCTPRVTTQRVLKHSAHSFVGSSSSSAAQNLITRSLRSNQASSSFDGPINFIGI